MSSSNNSNGKSIGTAVIVGASLAYALYLKTKKKATVQDYQSNSRTRKEEDTESTRSKMFQEEGDDENDEAEYSVAGLTNSGNTCFVNATLQALASVQDKLLPYLSWKPPSSTNNNGTIILPSTNSAGIGPAVANALKGLKATPSSPTSRRSVDIKDILDWVRQKAKLFARHEQQDAEELLQVLFSSLDSEKMILKSLCDTNDVVINPMKGSFGSVLQCNTCKDLRPSTKSDFIDISLALPQELEHRSTTTTTTTNDENLTSSPYTLTQCLDAFTSAETIPGVECMNCTIATEASKIEQQILQLRIVTDHLSMHASTSLFEEIKDLENQLTLLESNAESKKNENNMVKRDFTKQLFIASPPELLCIHMVRKIYSARYGAVTKLDQQIDFSVDLDLSKYCRATDEEERDDKSHEDDDQLIYELQAVVVHHGNANSGHYTTYRRRTKDDVDKWVHISDSTVHNVSLDEVLRAKAYLLFYSKEARAE